MEGARRARTAGGSACTRRHAAGFVTGGSPGQLRSEKTTPRLRAAESQTEKRPWDGAHGPTRSCQPGVAAARPRCGPRAASAEPQAAREGCGRPKAAGGRWPRPHFHTMQGRRLRLLAAPVLSRDTRCSVSSPPCPADSGLLHQASTSTGLLGSQCHRQTPQSHCGIELWLWVLVDSLGACHMQP